MALTYQLPRGDALNSLFQGVSEAARQKLILKLNALRRMAQMAGPVGARAEACALPSQRLSAASLKRAWYDYQRTGGDVAVLLDKAMTREKPVPFEFLDLYWWPLIAGNDKKKMLTAYRAFLREWCVDGKRLPGIGTWQEWAAGHGVKVSRGQSCPWGMASGHQPPRLSYRNLANEGYKPTKKELAPSVGLAAVRMGTLGVHQDLSRLRFMEAIVIDDAEPDFYVIGPNGRPVKLLMVAAMDVASRMVLRYSLRLKEEREDGTTMGISRDMVRRMLAGLFREHGYPVDYPCTVIAENAAAAVTEEFEAALGMATNGIVGVKRTAVFKSDVMLRGLVESAGNPRGKLIEGLWSMAWNELGWVPGQSGSNWTKKPGVLPAMLKASETLAKAQLWIDRLELPVAGTLQNPLLSPQEARREIDKVWRLINEREWHNINGFHDVTRWKYPTEGWDAWKPYGQLVEICRERGQDLELMLNMRMVDTRKGRETPLERAARLRAGAEFATIADADAHMLLADHSKFTYGGTGGVRVIRDKQTYWFDVRSLTLTEGREYLGYFDAEAMARQDGQLVIVDAERRAWIGTAPQQAATPWGDAKALAESIAERERHTRRIMDDAARRLNRDPELAARLEAVEGAERAAEMLAQVAQVPESVREALPTAAGRALPRATEAEEEDHQAAMLRAYGVEAG